MLHTTSFIIDLGIFLLQSLKVDKGEISGLGKSETLHSVSFLFYLELQRVSTAWNLLFLLFLITKMLLINNLLLLMWNLLFLLYFYVKLSRFVG